MKTDHAIALISTIRDKANKLINKELRTRNLLGLTPSHGAILFELFHSGTISMKELQKGLTDKSTVTALKGMTWDIEKTRHPNDNGKCDKLTKRAEWADTTDLKILTEYMVILQDETIIQG
jgi:hypothetical protein